MDSTLRVASAAATELVADFSAHRRGRGKLFVFASADKLKAFLAHAGEGGRLTIPQPESSGKFLVCSGIFSSVEKRKGRAGAVCLCHDRFFVMMPSLSVLLAEAWVLISARGNRLPIYRF